MPNSSDTCKFNALYNAPVDIQKPLVGNQLQPHPSSIEKMKLATSLNNAQERFGRLPKISLADKKTELEALFDEYRRDTYRPTITSISEEISEEIVDSITSWLSDIWQTVYEFGVDFENAHQCLKFSCEALYRLSTTGNGCKCIFMNMYLPISIKDSSNTVIKHFSYPGAYLLEDTFLWIWREMLLKMLASGEHRYIAAIPDMLKDIQSTTAEWGTSLDRLLIAGGRVCSNDVDEKYMFEEEGDDVDDVQCPSHAVHWPDSLVEHLPALRTHISTALLEAFQLTPSLSLYNTITSLSPLAIPLLVLHLKQEARHDPAAAATALEIYAANGDCDAIASTLEVARPILRNRDGVAVRVAVHALASHAKHIGLALHIIERELRDCLEALHAMIINHVFGDIEKAESQILLTEATLLDMESQARKDAIDHWADTIIPNPWDDSPMSVTEFLMGFPHVFSPSSAQDPDPFFFGEVREDHPDYEDLRDEWRPRLKERFDDWVSLAASLKSFGLSILRRIEDTINERMPYLAYRDVAEEMIGRIHDKPHSYHICDALDIMSRFMQTQQAKALSEKLQVAAKMAEMNSLMQQNASISSNYVRPSGSVSSFFDMNAGDFTISGLGALD
ncbi:hypothetical protein BU17DRAFT_90843 [Hysterangium stoloniferum]|nr:hypothetical protein BU17DRAFT_90843 [Hysterangium stoloniferum]